MHQATEPFSKRPAAQPKNNLSSAITIPHFQSDLFAARFKSVQRTTDFAAGLTNLIDYI